MNPESKSPLDDAEIVRGCGLAEPAPKLGLSVSRPPNNGHDRPVRRQPSRALAFNSFDGSVIATVGLAACFSSCNTAQIDRSMTPPRVRPSTRPRTVLSLRSRTPRTAWPVTSLPRRHVSPETFSTTTTNSPRTSSRRRCSKSTSRRRLRCFGRPYRTASGHSRGAGIPQRKNHEQGKTRTADYPEQRANNAHEGQRFLADLEVGSIRMINLCSVDSNRYPANSAGAILIARERHYRCR